MALVIFGTIFVASASEGQSAANGGTAFSIMVHDVAYLILGIFALYFAARVRLERLVRSAPLLMLGGLFLLLAVKAVGVTTNGGKRWLNLRVIDLQPSELFKLCTVVFLAWLVQHHHEELNNWRQLAVWTAPIWLGCGFIVLEPDIGTASVVLVIALSMLAIAGLSRHLFLGVVVATIAAVGTYLGVEPYSAKRFFSFLHPNTNLLGSGYQLLQSRIGLGAGGISGLGLGHSREKWGLLPNPHTDFIFTIVGEELGIIGTLAVIALFVAFLMVSVRIAQQVLEPGLPAHRGGHHHVDHRRSAHQHLLSGRVVGRDRGAAALLLLWRDGAHHRAGGRRTAVQHRPRPFTLGRPHDPRQPAHQLSRDL